MSLTHKAPPSNVREIYSSLIARTPFAKLPHGTMYNRLGALLIILYDVMKVGVSMYVMSVAACVCYVTATLVVLALLFYLFCCMRKVFAHFMSSLDHIDNEIDNLSAYASYCIDEMRAELKLRRAERENSKLVSTDE